MRIKRFGFVLACFAGIMAGRGEAYMQKLSPEAFRTMYALAASGKTSYLTNAVNRGLNINAVNANGDTGLCIAAKRYDTTAFRTFLQAGANPSHPCTWKIKDYREFMEDAIHEKPSKASISTKYTGRSIFDDVDWGSIGWAGAGLTAATVGVIMAVSGGGGGGGSGGSVTPTDECVSQGGTRTEPGEGYKYITATVGGKICYLNVTAKTCSDYSDYPYEYCQSGCSCASQNKPSGDGTKTCYQWSGCTDECTEQGGTRTKPGEGYKYDTVIIEGAVCYKNIEAKTCADYSDYPETSCVTGCTCSNASKPTGSTITTCYHLDTCQGACEAEGGTTTKPGDGYNYDTKVYPGEGICYINITAKTCADYSPYIYGSCGGNYTCSETSAKLGDITSTCYERTGCQAAYCGTTCTTEVKTCSSSEYPYGEIEHATMGESCTPNKQSASSSFQCESGTTIYKSFECVSGWEKTADQKSCQKIDCHQGYWSESEGKCVCFFGYEGSRCTQVKAYNNLNSEYTGAEITTEADGTIVSTIDKKYADGLTYVSDGMKAGDNDTLYNGYYEVSNSTTDINHKWVIATTNLDVIGMLNESGNICPLYIEGIDGYQPSGAYTSEITVKAGLERVDYEGQEVYCPYPRSAIITASGDVMMSKCINCAESITLANILNGNNVTYGVRTNGNFTNDGHMELNLETAGPVTGVYAGGDVINGKDGVIDVRNTYNYSVGDYYNSAGINAVGVVTNYGTIRSGSLRSNSYTIIAGIKAPVVNNYGLIESVEGIWFDYGDGGIFTNFESGRIYTFKVDGGYPGKGMYGQTLINKGTIVLIDYAYGGLVTSNGGTAVNYGSIITNDDYVKEYYPDKKVIRISGIYATSSENYPLSTVMNNGIIDLIGSDESSFINGISTTASAVNNKGKIYINKDFDEGSEVKAVGIGSSGGWAKGIGTVENTGEIIVSSSKGGAVGIDTDYINQITNKKTVEAYSIDGIATGLNAYGDTLNPYDQHITTSILNTGTIKAVSQNKYATGVYLVYIKSMKNSGKIEAIGVGSVRGLSASKADFVNENKGIISSTYTLSSGEYDYSATGVYASNESVITNESGALIEVTAASGSAYGIYARNSEVTNAGTITVTGPEGKSWGIYAVNNSTVTNSGTITVNNNSCTGAGCTNDGVHIYIDGDSTLNNASLMSFSSALDTASLGGGELNMMEGGVLEAPEISGEVGVATSVVSSGFEDTYTMEDAIISDDTSGLNLKSQSVMFDASLDGQDIVMTKKSFEDVTENSSFGAFLENNYAASNNESLFERLKSQTSQAGFDDMVSSLQGDGLKRFAFEDMTTYEQLNFDMNNALFDNVKTDFTLTGNTSPLNLETRGGSNTRWMVSGKKIGDQSYGVGLAFTTINSQDSSDENSRQDEQFQMMAPFGYNTHGFEFIVSPRLGYAYGHYTRDGFNDSEYDGKVEKKIYGVTNAARYPVKVNGWTLAPQAEFNVMGYHIKGHEEDKVYALNIPSQNVTSVEAGFGLSASKEYKFADKHNLKLNAGVMAYHEFADPYELKLAMRGMDGSWRIRDDRRRDDHIAVRGGFEYALEPFDVYANIYSYIDSEYRTKADLGIRYHF